WVEQGSVIGKRYVIQVFARVVGIERTPAAVRALQPQNPFTSAVDAATEVRFAARDAGPRESVHRRHDGGRIVEMGIMRVGILKCPATGTHMRPPPRPSSPLRRSVTKGTALSIARPRIAEGTKGSIQRRIESIAEKRANRRRD